jgi:hypothetical protein
VRLSMAAPRGLTGYPNVWGCVSNGFDHAAGSQRYRISARSNPVKIMRACRAFDFDGPQIAVAGSLAGDPRIRFGFCI